MKILILLLLVSITTINSQIIVIQGNVTTSTTVVNNVVLTFTNANDTTTSYSTLTNSLGNYSIGLITGIEENDPSIPVHFELTQNYPNPFSNETVIPYKLNINSKVNVTVYDILGREVRKFSIGEQAAGIHGIIWDGNNNFGQKLSTGIYFYKMEAGNESLVNKMVLTRGIGASNNLTLTGIFTSPAKFFQKKVTKINSDSYYVKITNTDITMPRIAEIEVENVIIANDTTINFSVNKLPIANAGKDDSIKVGQYVTLDGSQSKMGDGDILYYDWVPDSTNPAKVRILWAKIQPNVAFSSPGTYKFSLVVNDGIADSDPDEVVIEVGERGEIIFEDAVLESYVRYELKDPKGELTEEKLESMTHLHPEGIFGDITSLAGIENCKNLKILLLGLNKITNLEPLSSLTNLEELYLSQNRTFTDLSPLASLVNLKELDLSSNLIADISSLRSLTNLTTLNLMWNEITDISPLAEMINLEKLIIFSNQITDITPISNLTQLIELDFTYNQIFDITGISSMNELYRLDLVHNKVIDIKPLEEGLEKLKFLDLDHNQITNIEPLVNNTNFGQGDYIFLTGNPLDEISRDQYIRELRNRGVIVTFN
jgi:Leucine-rich repeat (LRR) protein